MGTPPFDEEILMSRPICVRCGTPYGQRNTTTETVRCARGETPPPYQGNGIVVGEYEWPSPASGGRAIDRTIWDGESWLATARPFCTLRCALAYARAAVANGGPRGIRTPDLRDADATLSP